MACICRVYTHTPGQNKIRSKDKRQTLSIKFLSSSLLTCAYHHGLCQSDRDKEERGSVLQILHPIDPRLMFPNSAACIVQQEERQREIESNGGPPRIPLTLSLSTLLEVCVTCCINFRNTTPCFPARTHRHTRYLCIYICVCVYMYEQKAHTSNSKGPSGTISPPNLVGNGPCVLSTLDHTLLVVNVVIGWVHLPPHHRHLRARTLAFQGCAGTRKGGWSSLTLRVTIP